MKTASRRSGKQGTDCEQAAVPLVSVSWKSGNPIHPALTSAGTRSSAPSARGRLVQEVKTGTERPLALAVVQNWFAEFRKVTVTWGRASALQIGARKQA